MIDFDRFLSECARPFDDVSANCFTSALAAFPTSAKVAALSEWWTSLPTEEKATFAASSRLTPIVAERADAFHFRWCPTVATGREIGVAEYAGLFPPTLCVGAEGHWFARGHNGAVRLPRKVVVKAWRVL